MKKMIAVIGIAALLAMVSLTASAQTPAYNSSGVGGPLLIPAATTTNLATPIYIDCSRSQLIGLQADVSWSTAGESTGNTNLIYTAGPSINGVTYSTNEAQITFVAYNRQGTVGLQTHSVTNVNIGSYQGYYVYKIANNSAVGIATNTLSAGNKISSP
jgi:hypothetical protein